MIRLLLLFVILLSAVWLGLQLNHDPGYILITMNHWTIETTVWIAIAALVLLYLFLHVLLGLINRIIHIPSHYRRWRKKRRILRAQATTRQGLIEFSEGYWASARNHLIKALPETDSPLLNYLTAARAAQEMGESQLRDNYLREAQQSMPDAKIAVGLTQAQLQLANHQWEQALATLRHLQDLAPHHPYVLKLLMRLYQEVRDWPQLIMLLPELKKNQIIDDMTYQKIQHQAYSCALNDLIRLVQPDAIEHFIKKLPKALQNDPEIIASYCKFLIAHEKAHIAETILHRCLKKHYHEKLILIYSDINISEKQLTFAESLLKKHNDSAALYLCLGKLSTAYNLWGKARNYLEKSLAIHPTPEAFWEMGKLYEQFNDSLQATKAFEDGLRLANKK